MSPISSASIESTTLYQVGLCMWSVIFDLTTSLDVWNNHAPPFFIFVLLIASFVLSYFTLCTMWSWGWKYPLLPSFFFHKCCISHWLSILSFLAFIMFFKKIQLWESPCARTERPVRPAVPGLEAGGPGYEGRSRVAANGAQGGQKVLLCQHARSRQRGVRWRGG